MSTLSDDEKVEMVCRRMRAIFGACKRVGRREPTSAADRGNATLHAALNVAAAEMTAFYALDDEPIGFETDLARVAFRAMQAEVDRAIAARN